MIGLVENKQNIDIINKYLVNKSIGIPYSVSNNTSTEKNIISEKMEESSMSVKYKDTVSTSDSVELPKMQIDKINQIRKNIVEIFRMEILGVIQSDYYEDGEISKSEQYMLETYTEENGDYIKDALMHIFGENFFNEHILAGVLTMIATKSYEEMAYQGQTIALALLQHESMYLRDKAIQTYEIWNSKKGIPILKSLRCDQKWLQDYVDKVIFYLQRDGVE